MNEQIKHYGAIDVMKFIASLLVVAIHTSPLISISIYLNSALIQGVARMAVPFFFMSSGFFLCRKLEDINKIKSYVFRILKLYIIWTIIYFPIIIYGWISNGKNIIYNIMEFIRTSIFVGTYAQFWYFYALIFSVWFLCLCLVKVSLKNKLILSSSLYFIGLFGNSYHESIKSAPVISTVFEYYFKLFLTTRNGLFFGSLFITLGFLIFEEKVLFTKKAALSGFIISIILMYLEIFILKYFLDAERFDMYISLIPATFFLFLLLKQLKSPENNLFLFFRKSSILIFSSHMLIRFLYDAIISRAGVNLIFTNSLFRYFAIILLSIFFSFAIICLENKNELKWLKKLH